MITAHQHTVAAVLGDEFIHEVPRYQRPYAWTKTEALQLFEDLLEAQATPSEPYFLGSIVLVRPKGEKRGQVVDGQQRLTTLTILAAVLRDLASGKEADALAEAVYIEPNKFKKQHEAVRLVGHPEDATFFREAIQIPGATAKAEPPEVARSEAQENMWANAQALRKRVLELSDGQRETLVEFLLGDCVLVVVSTESRAAALRIFSVLNDRGLDLSNADVIKADLLERFTEPAQLEHHAQQWRALEVDLGRGGFEALLDHLRFIREQRKNSRTLSEAYAERFRGQSADAVTAFFADELRPAKGWFAALLDGVADRFPVELQRAAAEALVGLRLLPNRDWTPAALAAALKFGPSAKTVEIWTQLEGLAWAMQLGRRYDTQRMGRYAEIVAALDQDDAAITKALKLTEGERAEAWAALNGPIYDAFPVRVVRAILERLDRLLAEQPIVWNGQITVEHILPQNPTSGEWGAFSDLDRQGGAHLLGNLVLLTKRKNSAASNNEFKQKRDVYFGLKTGDKRATYASVQELVDFEDWTPASLAARHGRHTALLGGHWGVAPPAAPGAA